MHIEYIQWWIKFWRSANFYLELTIKKKMKVKTRQK